MKTKTTEDQKGTLKYKFKYYVVTICILGAVLASVAIWNTRKITKQADQNNVQIEKMLSILDNSSLFTIKTDTANGRQYIDSVKVYPAEVKAFIEKQSTSKIVEYNEMLAKTASEANNTLVLWATLLTLLSIMFTFLGLVELKDRLNRVEKGISELDAKKKEIEKMQTNIELMQADVDVKFERIQKDVKISQYNSELQIAISLSKTDERDAISQLDSLIDKIKIDICLERQEKEYLLSDIYFTMGWLYRSLKDLNNSIWAYDRTIDVFPLGYKAFNDRGSIYLDQGEFDKALSDFNDAIRLNSNSDIAYYNRGILYFKQGNLKEALFDYNDAIQINQDNSFAYNNRGLVYKLLDDFEKAFSDFNKSIQLNSSNAEAYYNRGNIYCDLDDFGKAISDYTEAIKLNTSYANGYNNRGKVYEKQGDAELEKEKKNVFYAKAINDFEKYIKLETDEDDIKEAQERIEEIKTKMK